ncbi:MAG: bifunctional UDP-N-acetylglucosamine diphosphorylase/glucosamine-1-phosphate N-acetyltransferase GlmU [Azoarcus sp.]|jgi:bifunctional UDP-N-acetylglucosamine pyrophosphorylase/glucosamine-1-phosphate N-acetyltransferase|nr:bifunctional UDP-N-acetylglucosamine diphosphorylase/glucosamine-1-phosphate N-acetyltransferase GlmU [Azoarcus sp.]
MEVVILAAGQGKRMRSVLPKVLQPLAGRPLLTHVLTSARALGAQRICVVYGHGGEAVRTRLDAPDLAWAEQNPQLGTGHAVLQAVPHLSSDAQVLVLYGDVPLIGVPTLTRLIEAAGRDRLALLTAEFDNPTGYGRILRDAAGRVTRIVEEKDATQEERRVREINTGILVAPVTRLRDWLGRIGNDNAQGEYYLTDVVGLAVEDGVGIVTAAPDSIAETLGVNSKAQLAGLERVYQTSIANTLMDAGVTLIDPARLDVRGALICGRDVEIDVNCVFEGRVELGDGVVVSAHCVLRDVRIGAGSRIAPFSHLDSTVAGEACVIGPYARTRPGTVLGNGVHVGNFVEIKNSKVADHSKANHLAYVGDADVGARVNIGAGTITCNYDGANKYRTEIGDDVFIGSDTQLVAPVRIGRGATIGAGTTLTRNAPPDQLTVSRARQQTIAGWSRPVKKTD